MTRRQDRKTPQDPARTLPPASPGLPALVLARPPWVAVALAVLALALARAPAPVALAENAIDPRRLALPCLALALAAAVPALLRALSQARALTTGEWLAAKVTQVETLSSNPGLPRHRILWADALGRAGRSLVIHKRWVPPKGTTIRVVQDPSSGRQWWQGDIPGTLPQDKLFAGAASGEVRPGARIRAMLGFPSTWIAGFAGLVAGLLLLGAAPALLWLPTAMVAAEGLRRARARLRAMDRALRHGPRLTAKVLRHGHPPISGLSLRNRAGASMEWQTPQGHFGATDYVAATQLVAVGATLSVRVDPVTGEAFWEGPAG